MRRSKRIETGHERVLLAREAGFGRISLVSVLAGAMAAFGAFVVLSAAVAAILRGLGMEVDYSVGEWRTIGTGAAVALALVLLASWTFGGYVAGRMARRAGSTHGLLVFVVGVLVAVGAALVVNALAEPDAILDDLRALGIPTTADEWGDIGTAAGIASVAAMLVGALIGGPLGERWHERLLRRAVDPEIGPAAAAARDAAVAHAVAGRADRTSVVDRARARDGADRDADTDTERDGNRDTDVTADVPTARRRGLLRR